MGNPYDNVVLKDGTLLCPGGIQKRKGQIYVKKLWSLNPTKYRKISLKSASKDYLGYIKACVDIRPNIYGADKTFEKLFNGKFEDIGIKPFTVWLKTEI